MLRIKDDDVLACDPLRNYILISGRARRPRRSDLEESDRLRSVNIPLLVEDSPAVTVNVVGV
jgi:hypothetical protein